ncbi:MAG: hypothetical protein RLZZ444_1893 [Pseudomonadota bacterium]|jgi:drug/metabolite transporter (DMT)-like permease
MQNRTALGVLSLCLGVLVFSLQDAIIKGISGAYPLTQVVSTRCLVATPILLLAVHLESGVRSIATKNFWPLVLRSLIMLVAYTTYYMAFPALPLADAVALYFTVPLFTLALGATLFGETIGWRRIGAVLVGFLGVIVMLRPGAGLFEPAALLTLFSAATYATSMLMARKLGNEESASVMAFYQNWVYLVGALTMALCFHLAGFENATHPSINFLVRSWTWPTLNDFLLTASCGVIAAIGMMLLTQAYRIAKPSIVTSFEYTGLIWAPLWGFLFFAEVPHVTTVFGAILIIAGGLIALSSPAAKNDTAQPN